MLKNYFKVALRNIARNKTYTTINVLGLALGICACISIYTIVHFEFSFDRHHKQHERIYRLMADVTETTGEVLHFGRTPYTVATAATNGFSGIENSAVIIPYNVAIAVPAGDQPAALFESRLPSTLFVTTAVTGSSYFSMFNYRLLAGNTAALDIPFKVLLTESRARQYFGNGPLDKMLNKTVAYADSLRCSVAGIVADPSSNTDLAFTDFISASSIQTTGATAWTFLKLRQGTMVKKVNTWLQRIPKDREEHGIARSLWLEPLSEMHFNANVIENSIRTADRSTLHSLTGIAFFILLLAIINFINLSTAQSLYRAKEAGIRKVLGSTRTALVFQFLTEAFVLTLIAFVLALLLVKPVLYAFKDFIPEGIIFRLSDPVMASFLLCMLLLTTLLAGLYPAKVLSFFPAINNLKRGGTGNAGKQLFFRRSLIVFQFAVSLIFISGSIVIARQLHFMRMQNPGFSSDAIVISQVPGGGYAKLSVYAKRIKQVTGVSQVALQWVPPMTDNTRGMKLKLHPTDDKEFGVTQVAGNEDFIPLYHIKLLAGRNLLPADSVRELVISETLSKQLGDSISSASLGKTLYWNDKPYPVIGVVSDFHTKSLHDPVTTLCIINRHDRLSAVAVSLGANGNPGTVQQSIAGIEHAFKQVYPEGTFSYRFFDESIAMLYEKDRKTARLINTATGITIFISCIGLFGLALFTAQKRSKEISIRKVLGATITNIVVMLSKDFVILVVIAFVIATPVAWHLSNQWLQEFAYRTSVGAWVFLLAGLSAIFIALLTIGFQSVKAAAANPVKNLRNE